MRQSLEFGHFRLVHRPALKAETQPRSIRKTFEIPSLAGTQIPFGRDVHPDRFDDHRCEPFLQNLGTEILVTGVQATICDIFAEIMRQMAEIVEETGRDDRWILAVFLCESGTLKGVLRLCDVFAIMPMTTFGIDPEYRIDDFVGCHESLSLSENQR